MATEVTIKAGDKNLSELVSIIITQLIPDHRESTIQKKAEGLHNLIKETMPDKLISKKKIEEALFLPHYSKRDIQWSQVLRKDFNALIVNCLKYKCDKVGAVKEKYNETRASIVKIFQAIEGYEKASKPVNLINDFFRKRHYFSYLEGSKWFVFERVGGNSNDPKKWGYSIGILEFIGNSQKEYLEVKLQSQFDGHNSEYRGIAMPDRARHYMHIYLQESNGFHSEDFTSRVSQMVLPLNSVESHTMFLGHLTFHSKRYSRLNTKTIILLNLNSEEGKKIKISSPTAYYKSSEQIHEIPLVISQFLYNRSLNRLSLPLNTITNSQELNLFIDTNRNSHRSSKMDYFCKDFVIMFLDNDKKLSKDKLRIEFSHEEQTYQGRLEHYPTHSEDSHKRVFHGTVHLISDKTICLELSNEKFNTLTDFEEPVLLSFSIPVDDIHFKDCEFFPGLISGLNDSDKRPAATNCLVIKKDDNKVDEKIALGFLMKWSIFIMPEHKFKYSDFD